MSKCWGVFQTHEDTLQTQAFSEGPQKTFERTRAREGPAEMTARYTSRQMGAHRALGEHSEGLHLSTRVPFSLELIYSRFFRCVLESPAPGTGPEGRHVQTEPGTRRPGHRSCSRWPGGRQLPGATWRPLGTVTLGAVRAL